MQKNIILLGAGSHARVVLDVLRVAGLGRAVLGVVDLADNPLLRGATLDGVQVAGALEDLPRLRGLGARRCVPAIGDNRMRERACREAVEGGLFLAEAFHPSAVLSKRSRMDSGIVACAGASVGTGARIGQGVILNTGCIVDHDCRIGPYAHIAPGARLAGNVTVGARAWVGIGASVREGIRIGDDAIVGAGAVVVHDVPAGVTVAGIPAKPLKK